MKVTWKSDDLDKENDEPVPAAGDRADHDLL